MPDPADPALVAPAPRTSTSARLAVIAYAALLVYASLYPMSGWRDAGVAPWAFLTAPVPRYITRFDIVTNLIAYAPWGALLVLAAYPRRRRHRAVIDATLIAATLSATLEALQTYLPNRVSSNLDLAMNTLGALLGALACAPLAPAILERGRVRDVRQRWFTPDAAGTLVVMALWWIALLIPHPMLFGLGDVVTPVRAVLDALAETPIAWHAPFAFTPEQAVATEALATASALAGATLLLLHATRVEAPRMRIALVVAASAAIACAIASGVVLSASDALHWASPGAVLGLTFGLGIAVGAAWAPRTVQRGFATALIAGSALTVNLAPEDPYFAATMAAWHPQQWANVAGLLRALGAAWPLVALAWLMRRGSRERAR